jgi:ATP-dependent DNA ligase
MKKEDRISEREYRGRLESLLKSAFNTQLQPLRSLETATAEKEGRKRFWIHEIKHDGFWLMVRPAALSTR